MKLPKIDWMTGLLLASGVLVVGYVLLRETEFGQQILADSLKDESYVEGMYEDAPNLDPDIKEKL